MTDPPSSVGASHEISIVEPLANVFMGALGASGATAALSDVESEGSPSPTSFYAITMNSYTYPLPRPVSVNVVVAGPVVPI